MKIKIERRTLLIQKKNKIKKKIIISSPPDTFFACGSPPRGELEEGGKDTFVHCTCNTRAEFYIRLVLFWSYNANFKLESGVVSLLVFKAVVMLS
jgi:hypothetical protein